MVNLFKKGELVIFFYVSAILVAAFALAERPAAAYATDNLPDIIVSDNNASAGGVSNARCAYIYECKQTGEGSYWFGCYADGGLCRCYKGDILSCNVSRSSLTMSEWCSEQYECKRRADGRYWYKCYYDYTTYECRCYITSSLCSQGSNDTSQTQAPLGTAESVDNFPEKKSSLFSSITGSVVSGVKSGYSNRIVRIAVPALVIAAALAVYLINRDTRANNLRKARKYHRLGEKCHNAGDEENAKRYYELSQMLREKGGL